MTQTITLTTPLSEECIRSLRAGSRVKINGMLYTARDMAHKKMCAAIESGDSLPFDLQGAVIYYVGPTPARPNRPIGAAGPTTSARMDDFSPMLYAEGLAATIGKGYRGVHVVEALRKYGAVHFSAIGGAAALLSRHILESRIIAYPELGTEAVRELRVLDFPAIVAYDSVGNSVYKNSNYTKRQV